MFTNLSMVSPFPVESKEFRMCNGWISKINCVLRQVASQKERFIAKIQDIIYFLGQNIFTKQNSVILDHRQSSDQRLIWKSVGYFQANFKKFYCVQTFPRDGNITGYCNQIFFLSSDHFSVKSRLYFCTLITSVYLTLTIYARWANTSVLWSVSTTLSMSTSVLWSVSVYYFVDTLDQKILINPAVHEFELNDSFIIFSTFFVVPNWIEFPLFCLLLFVYIQKPVL